MTSRGRGRERDLPDATYPPLDVLKPVAEGVWIVDSGPLRALGIPLPVRMTVVRLGDGSVWLHSPTRYDAGLHRAIAALGPIRHLVAPNIAHWTFLKDWQAQCPEALTWAAPNLRERRQVTQMQGALERRNALIELGDRLRDACTVSTVAPSVSPGIDQDNVIDMRRLRGS